MRLCLINRMMCGGICMFDNTRKVIPAVLMLIFAACSICFPYPLGKPDTGYQYKLTGDINSRPEEARNNGSIVVEAEVVLGPVVDRRYQWVELSFTRQNGRKYDALLLMDKWPGKKGTPNVLRYLWHEPDWPDYLEYVNEITGKAELPRFDLWKYGWPQTADAKASCSFSKAPKDIQLHGWIFKLDKKIKRVVTVPARTTVIKLNPDVIIGLSGVHRDIDGRHKDNLGRTTYDYIVPQSDEDRRKEIESA